MKRLSYLFLAVLMTLTLVLTAGAESYAEYISGAKTNDLRREFQDGYCIHCDEPEAGVVARGFAGSNITWLLDGNGHLSFTGYGDMYDYSDWDGNNPAPWSDYMSLVKTVCMDDRITGLSDNAFNYFRKIEKVSLPDSLTRIGAYAFAYCENLEFVVIPQGVTEIGDFAFMKCTALESAPLPQGLVSLGGCAFFDCSALTSMNIPEGVTALGSNTFSGCSALEEVVLPESLTSISYECFKFCTSLKSVVLPENLEDVSRDIFLDSGVEKITFRGPLPLYLDPNAFQGVSAQVFYPAGDSTWTEEARGQYGGTLTWTASEEISAHNWIAATCTQPLTCADCGKSVGQAPGHSMSDWSQILDPGCTEPGTKQKKCWNCDYTEEVKIEAFGHDYVEEGKNPTCLESGFFRIRCTLCEFILEEAVYEALGHDYYLSQMILASCSKPGGELYICSRCERTESVYLPMTDHDISEFYRIDNCAEGGEYVHRCRNCGYEETEPVAPKEHNYVIYESTEPNCWNPGYTHYDCTDCLLGYSESTDALGHDYVTEVIAEKTCEQDGQEIRTCKRCGEERTFTYTTGGHQYALIYVDATCVEDGYWVRVCNFCGDSKDYTVLKAQGHSWSGSVCRLCGMDKSIGFRDVVAGSYYELPVNWAVQKGITTGTSATTFSPDDPCTRGQVVTFLWRAAGEPEPASSDNPFADVAESDYFYKAVLWAVEQGITNGMSDTTFAPGDPCTRAQVATFLWRSAGKPAPTSQQHSFTDITGDYYYDAVLWAVEMGITNGTSDTTFSPAATCTRAQIVTFLYRFLG